MKLETPEGPDHKVPIVHSPVGAGCQTQTGSTMPDPSTSHFTDSQRGWEADRTGVQSLPSPNEQNIHLGNSSVMLAFKVYWQLFGPNTQNSTWTTKEVFKQSRQLRKTSLPPKSIQNKQCKMGKGVLVITFFFLTDKSDIFFPPRNKVFHCLNSHMSFCHIN